MSICQAHVNVDALNCAYVANLKYGRTVTKLELARLAYR